MEGSRDIQRHLIGTVMAFCRLSVHGDEDIREDLADACMGLLDIWLFGDGVARMDMLRRWCRDTAAVLDRLEGVPGAQGHALLRAQARFLRMRAAVGIEMAVPVRATPKKPTPPVPAMRINDLGKTQKKVLQWLRANSGARMRELVAQFSEELSDRTIKRVLKELADAGFVQRIERDGKTFYECEGANA